MAIQLRPERDTTSPRLYDSHGNTIPRRVRDVNLGNTRGGAGFSIHGGYIAEKERDASLIGRNRFLTYSNILADSTIVASGVRYFLNLAAKTPWKVRPASDEDDAREKAEFVEKMLHDMATPLHKVVRQAAMHRMWGFATMEWTAARNDEGQYVVKYIENRAQWTIELWDTDFAGRVLGIVQRPAQDLGRSIYIPRAKLVYLCDNSFTDDPRGVGLLRHVARPVKQLREYERLEHLGYETDMRGIPVAKGPLAELQAAVNTKKITQDQANALIQPLRDFITNHIRGTDSGIVLDSSVYAGSGEDETPIKAAKYEIDLLSGGSYGHKEIAEAIERINREIARVLGVEQLLLGADSAGSLALSRDKSQAFFMVVNSALTEIRSAFRKDVLEPIWLLNGFDEDLMPDLDFENVEFKDPEQVSKVVKDLATSGVPIDPQDDLVDELLAIVGLSPLNQKLREELMQRRVQNAKLGLDENGLPLPGGPMGGGAPASPGGAKRPSDLSGNLAGVDPGGSADDKLRARQGREAAARNKPTPKKPNAPS